MALSRITSDQDDEEEETESDSKNDYANPADSMVTSSKRKKLKKFDFVTEGGELMRFSTSGVVIVLYGNRLGRLEQNLTEV
ncbi:hypothetical protein Tco_1359812 [Tanacetum coccineum]